MTVTSLTPDQAQTIHKQAQGLLWQLQRVIVGQQPLLERLLIALLARGHVLIEGIPGLAKTLMVKALARSLGVCFSRIQLTPDLLPGDLTGTRVFLPETRQFSVETGPLFAHLVLADEINRAPAKVQSALLEAMAESQITIGKETFSLPSPYMVLATANSIEHDGTYRLPEAQLDRFLFKLRIEPPTAAEELAILQRSLAGELASSALDTLSVVVTVEQLKAWQAAVSGVFLSPVLQQWIVTVVQATRSQPERWWLGASPRATLGWARAAQAMALLQGRTQVLPQDLHNLASDILCHRLLPSTTTWTDTLDDTHIRQLLAEHPIPTPFVSA